MTLSHGIMVLQVRECSEHNLEHSQAVFQNAQFLSLGGNVLMWYELFIFSLLEAGVGLISV